MINNLLTLLPAFWIQGQEIQGLFFCYSGHIHINTHTVEHFYVSQGKAAKQRAEHRIKHTSNNKHKSQNLDTEFLSLSLIQAFTHLAVPFVLVKIR